MKATNFYLSAIVGTLLWATGGFGQKLSPIASGNPMPNGKAGAQERAPMPAASAHDAPNLVPSPWVLGTCPDCCYPADGRVTIKSELFARVGPSVPFGGDLLSDSLDVGWKIEGGGRVLFFGGPDSSAWTVEIALSNTFNRVDSPLPVVTLQNIPIQTQLGGQAVAQQLTVQPRSLNRTQLQLGLGREWYLWGHAPCANDCGGWNWRFGFDVGGRWGTAKLQFDGLVLPGAPRHIDDVIGGAYAAIHSDIEFPCGGCVFYAGWRLEYAHTWSDILQMESDVDEALLLLTLGVRY